MKKDIKFSDNISEKTFWHNTLPYCTFKDPRYGNVDINKEFGEKLVKNYKAGIPTYKPALNIEHNRNNGKYGEIIDVEARDDGIYCKFELSDEGFKLLKDKKFDYLSAEYADNYLDKLNGKDVGPALLGCALTNAPAHPKMTKIKKFNEFMQYFSDLFGFNEEENNENIKQEEDNMPLDEKKFNDLVGSVAKLTESVTKLSEDNKKKDETIEKMIKAFTDQATEKETKAKEEKIKAWADDWKKKGVIPALVDSASKALSEKPDLEQSWNAQFEAIAKASNLTKQFGEVFDNKDKMKEFNDIVDSITNQLNGEE